MAVAGGEAGVDVEGLRSGLTYRDGQSEVGTHNRLADFDCHRPHHATVAGLVGIPAATGRGERRPGALRLAALDIVRGAGKPHRQKLRISPAIAPDLHRPRRNHCADAPIAEHAPTLRRFRREHRRLVGIQHVFVGLAGVPPVAHAVGAADVARIGETGRHPQNRLGRHVRAGPLVADVVMPVRRRIGQLGLLAAVGRCRATECPLTGLKGQTGIVETAHIRIHQRRTYLTQRRHDALNVRQVRPDVLLKRLGGRKSRARHGVAPRVLGARSRGLLGPPGGL